MNEQDFRHALRDTMTGVTAPPPMSETPVLEASKKAERRRKTWFAGAGSAAAVVVVAAVAVVLGGNGSPDGVQVGQPGPPAPASGSASAGASASDSAKAGPSDSAENTEPSWPDGQTDRTARQGPHFDKGEALLDTLTGAVPDGFEAPADLEYGDTSYYGKPRFSQSQFVDRVDGNEVWEYQAVQPVSSGDTVGRLLVQVTTPGSGMAGDGCALAPTFWGLEGTCADKVVGGKKVGVYTGTPDSDFQSWAGYRYDDGTVVFVAQSLAYPGCEKPALAAAPLSTDQLAALAVDERFLVK